MNPPVLEAKPPSVVQALCPRCSATLPAYEGSAVLPCGMCWPTMTPAERPPWLLALRRDPGHNMHRYRDPVLYAPPTLLAYVQHLEAQLTTPTPVVRRVEVWPGRMAIYCHATDASLPPIGGLILCDPDDLYRPGQWDGHGWYIQDANGTRLAHGPQTGIEGEQLLIAALRAVDIGVTP